MFHLKQLSQFVGNGNACCWLYMTVTSSRRCGLRHRGQLPLCCGWSLRVILPEHCSTLWPYLGQLVGLKWHDVLPLQLWSDSPLTHGPTCQDPIRDFRHKDVSFLLSPPSSPHSSSRCIEVLNTRGEGACWVDGCDGLAGWLEGDQGQGCGAEKGLHSRAEKQGR